MNKKSLILAIGLVLAMAFSAQAWNNQGQGRNINCAFQNPMEQCLAQLPAEKQAEVRKLLEQHRTQAYVQSQLIRAKHAKLDAALATLPLDKAKINALVEEVNQLRAKQFKYRTDFRVQMTELTGKPFIGPRHGQPGMRGEGMHKGMRGQRMKGMGQGRGQQLPPMPPAPEEPAE